jgi:hypothetical protein
VERFLLRVSGLSWLYPYKPRAERRRFLATVSRRSTNQALERHDPDRRYPIMLALVAQSAADQLDEVVALFDRAVSARESRAKSRTEEDLVERARRGEARHLLMDVILPGGRPVRAAAGRGLPALALVPGPSSASPCFLFCFVCFLPAYLDMSLIRA